MRGLAVGVRFEGILNPFPDAASRIQPAQELPPKIGRSRPHNGKQFRVDCWRQTSPCRKRLCRCELGTRLLYSFCTAALRASARRMTPARVKEGISHVASIFDRVFRADTRPAADV